MAMDTKEHERTYDGFITISKWGMIIVAVIVIGVVALIT